MPGFFFIITQKNPYLKIPDLHQKTITSITTISKYFITSGKSENDPLNNRYLQPAASISQAENINPAFMS